MDTVAWGTDDDDATGTEATVVVPHRSHKDTRRWCKGRPSRQHQPEVVIPENTSNVYGPKPVCRPNQWSGFGWLCFHAVVCSVCGKHLRGWGFLEPEECPDYDAGAAQAAMAWRRSKR